MKQKFRGRGGGMSDKREGKEKERREKQLGGRTGGREGDVGEKE